MMLKSIIDGINSFIPYQKYDSFNWKRQTFLEWFFFFLSEIPFVLIDKFKKTPHIKRIEDQKSLRMRILTTTIVFLVICTFLFFLLALPVLSSLNDPTLIPGLFLITIILGITTISWARFVYMSYDFKDLIKTKILHASNR